MGDIRDQLQTLTGADLLASQLSAAGGKAFVSTNATMTQMDMNDVTAFWRSIHVPTYGSPIASSGQNAVGNVDANPVVLQVAANDVAMLQAMSINNADAGTPAEVTLTLQNAVVMQVSIPPSTNQTVIGFQGIEPGVLHVVGGQSLDITATGPAGTDVQYVLTYCLTSQG